MMLMLARLTGLTVGTVLLLAAAINPDRWLPVILWIWGLASLLFLIMELRELRSFLRWWKHANRADLAAFERRVRR